MYCKECCIHSPLTLISTCSHLWSQPATLFLGRDHLTFNITLPPQTTFMNSSFTKCKHLFSLENDVLCVCWPSWILSTGHWFQSTRHLNRGVGTFNLDPPPTLPSPSMLQNPSKDSQLLCYCSLTTKQCLEYLSKTPALFCNHTAAICKSDLQLLNEYIYLQNQKVILKEEVVREAKYVLWSAFRAFWKEEGISEAWRGKCWLRLAWGNVGITLPNWRNSPGPKCNSMQSQEIPGSEMKCAIDIIPAFDATIKPGNISTKY